MTRIWRPVINLSALNGFVTLMKFQMEIVASVLGSARKRDWMFLIDLKDAYFQIPVHLKSRPYLQFCLEGHVCQSCALCSSLSTATQVFSRVFNLMSERVPPSLSGQLAGHCGVEDPSAASGSGSSVVQGPGDRC